MLQERFSFIGLLATLAALGLALSGVYVWLTWPEVWRWRDLEQPIAARDTEPDTAYLVQSSILNQASSTRLELSQVLLGAFRARYLLEVESWNVPKLPGTRLVLASPTLTGKKENINCGFMSYPYCGLYLLNPTSTSLVVWGEPLNGWLGLNRFVSPTHVEYSILWSMLDYSVMERRQLNLMTGELIPLRKLELDETDTSAELGISGEGRYLTLLVKGRLERSRLVPQIIEIQSENNVTVFKLSDVEVAKLANLVQTAASRLRPITLPLNGDADPIKLSLELYGQPFALDLATNRLTALGGK